MQQAVPVMTIDPIQPFDIAPEPRISNFERSLASAWAYANITARRAYLVGMMSAYINDDNLEHIDDIRFLNEFYNALEPTWNGPERRRAFYPLARMNISGSLLADIALHPERYTEQERQQRVADWNSTAAAAWDAGQEMLKFCEKRI